MNIRIERYYKTEYGKIYEFFRILIQEETDWIPPHKTVFNNINILELQSEEEAFSLLLAVIEWEMADKPTVVFESDAIEYLKELSKQAKEFYERT